MKQIRVLVVEDSPMQRELLVTLLKAAGAFQVVGTAGDGEAAVSQTLTLRPQIVAMDIHLPLMDGYEATRQIMQRCPTPIVMFSSNTGSAERRAMQALAAGALAVVRKPANLAHPSGAEERDAFLHILRLMSGVRVATRNAPQTPVVQPPPVIPHPLPLPGGGAPELLAVAASTGGPAAVQTLLAGLGPAFPLPVVVVQHIAKGFTAALVDWLASTTPMPMRVIDTETRLQPGHVYFAPDNSHVALSSYGLAAPRPRDPADRYCPSADTLFATVAQTYGSRAVGVILTGMGDDGARGMLELRNAGAPTFAQNEVTSVVYGMPMAAHAAGAVGHILPLDGLAAAVLTTLAMAEQAHIQA
jgi:two-component system chemotaxis response regulator CheB